MNFTDVFEYTTRNSSELREATEIVQRNSQLGIWLIGGFVYRNIAS